MEPGQKTQNNSPLIQPQPKDYPGTQAEKTGRLGYRRVRKWRIKGRLQKLVEMVERVPLLRRVIALSRQLTSIRKKDMGLKQGDFWIEEELPADINKLQEIIEDSALAQLPYELNWESVREAENLFDGKEEEDPRRPGLEKSRYQPESTIFHMLMEMKREGEAKFNDKLFKGLKLSPSGMLFDESTGLSVLMAKAQKTNKLKLIFGGTFSGAGAGAFKGKKGKRKFRRANLSVRQIIVDLKNLIGRKTKLYRQAAVLTEMIKELTDSEKQLKKLGLESSKGQLSLVGHSLGGGLAQYAAAKNDLGARAFSSAALGAKLLKDLSPEQKSKAKNGKVHNFLVANDPVNTPKGYKILHKQFKLSLIGKRTIIKGQKESGKNSLYGRHAWSHLHYISAVQKHYKRLPELLKQFPNLPFDKDLVSLFESMKDSIDQWIDKGNQEQVENFLNWLEEFMESDEVSSVDRVSASQLSEKVRQYLFERSGLVPPPGLS